jgi:hypothetical protein
VQNRFSGIGIRYRCYLTALWFELSGLRIGNIWPGDSPQQARHGADTNDGALPTPDLAHHGAVSTRDTQQGPTQAMVTRPGHHPHLTLHLHGHWWVAFAAPFEAPRLKIGKQPSQSRRDCRKNDNDLFIGIKAG